jgi:hypothetical protein
LEQLGIEPTTQNIAAATQPPGAWEKTGISQAFSLLALPSWAGKGAMADTRGDTDLDLCNMERLCVGPQT